MFSIGSIPLGPTVVLPLGVEASGASVSRVASAVYGARPRVVASAPSTGRRDEPALDAESERDAQARQRALWRMPLTVGATVGLGAPLGFVGAFAEVSPRRPWSLGWGVGVGTFGVAWAGSVRWAPLHHDGGATFVAAGYSGNFTPSDERGRMGWRVPAASRWANVEVGREWRFDARRSVRLAFGHAFLLNGGDFGCSSALGGACAAASETTMGGWAPYRGVATPSQAARASSLGEPRHFWFVHVDMGVLFGW